MKRSQDTRQADFNWSAENAEKGIDLLDQVSITKGTRKDDCNDASGISTNVTASNNSLRPSGMDASTLKEREGILEQIMRDLHTINSDPMYHHPSLEFFEERLDMYLTTLQELDHGKDVLR